ncbi:MAG TPA: hypothetical protein VFR81_14555 [Longimicrobium sp.]|nr:hypothetical protein [Longimicrobium sp.]
MPNAADPRRRGRAITPVASTFALLVSAACGRVGIAEGAEHPERLHGEWAVELRLEHSATLTRDTSRRVSVRGRMVLLENDRADAAAGLSGAPTHYGVYAADLRPLDLAGARGAPVLKARLTRADSVEIAFAPERGRGLVGRGTLAGDSVAGHWWTRGDRTAGRSSGTFVMRRP